MQKFIDDVTDLAGNAIPGATITVTIAETGALATLYSDAVGTTILENPVTSGDDGGFYFYAPNGRYDISVAKVSLPTQEVSGILLYDADDDPRVTTTMPGTGDGTGGGTGGGGTGGGTTVSGEVLIASTAPAELDKIDGAAGNVFVITLDADLVLPAVKNPKPGTCYKFALAQDSVGGHALSYNKLYRFPNNSVPINSKSAEVIDIVESDYLSSGFFFSRMFPGYSTSPIARIGITRYDTMALAMAAIQDGDTIFVTRDGKLLECVAAAYQTTGSYTIAGDPGFDGIPTLHTDGTIHHAFGKGIIDVETGTWLIRDLHFDGAVNDADPTISGVRVNPGMKYLRMERVTTTGCNNGQLAGKPLPEFVVGPGEFNIEYIDCVFDGNGNADGVENGQSHNIYLNEDIRAHALRTRFVNAVNGHDFKTRAAYVLLDRTYHEGAHGARELDVPQGGIIHAVNCTFRKLAGAIQSQLIGIGQEIPVTRANPAEYIFRNCVFDNQQGMNFGESWVNQANSTVPVKFVDCVFLGPSNAGMQSPFELYYTGGPIGPEGWDQSIVGVQPRRSVYDSSNGNNFFPADQQPQPIYGPDPTLAAFPPTGSTAVPTVRPD